MSCCSSELMNTEEETGEELLVFIRTVYIEAGILCFVSAITLLVISSLNISVVNILPIPPYVWLIFALVLLAVLICLPIRRIRRLIPWIVVGGVVAFFTLSAACFMCIYDIPDLVLYLAIMVLVVVGLMVCGARCRKSFLPNGLVTAVIVTLCLAALLPLIFLSLASIRYFFASFSAVLSVLVMTVIPLQTQFIHGRLQYSPIGLEPICATLIYLTSFALFICICVFSIAIESEILGAFNLHLAGLSTIPL
ncbi:NADH-quinone oxidoreductase subunit N [Drosophila teissieri]|uniref:NADH-quinone oxidoreductase subunit N n=1 Tax=Drosophila teissieri TaxID=7243 RepID=UPI001CBA3C48|nr:NADH-quinone oxidoreductase subunit N [Drosophila teissieri]